MNDEELFYDTSVLSNFARIERLELLWKYSQNVLTTREVILEVEKGIAKKPQLKSIVDAKENGKIQIISTSQEETILLLGQLREEGVLGKGEISLIGIAKERQAIFISDDKGATNKAKSLGIKVLHNVQYRDTVTILKTLLKDGIIEQAEYKLIQKLLKDNNFIF